MVEFFWVITILFLLFSSGYFSSSETALFSLSETKVKAFENSSNPREKLIHSLLSRPKDLLVTVFMLNTLVNILLQNVVSHAAGTSGSWLLKVVLPFALLLFVGEIVPKYFGLQKNVQLSRWSAPSINFFQQSLRLLREWTVRITAPVSRALFFYLQKKDDISYEELTHVLKHSEKHGVLLPEEAVLAQGYLNLQELSAKEAMRPREEMLIYDIDEPLTKLTHLFVDKEISRLPVCKGDLQNTIGIINAHDFFLHQNDILQPDFDLKNCLREPMYVPETTPAKLLLKRLNEKKEDLALVVDEYGAISGLITNEDLLETVVGEIHDPHDQQQLYTQPSSSELITSGGLELQEFNQLFDCYLKSPNNMVTISGWLIEKVGSIPKSGSKHHFDGFFFHVLEAKPNRVQRLFIKKEEKQ